MRISSLIIISLILSSCTSDAIWMKNPKGGEAINCGGKDIGLSKIEDIATEEDQCISDHKAQGYIKVPKP